MFEPGSQSRRAAIPRRVLFVAGALGLAATGLTACSSSTTTSSSTTVAAASPSSACSPPSSWKSTAAAPVAGSASDYNLTSFDGTKIRIHWFPNPTAGGKNLPTVLEGPGWGSAGDTSTTTAGIQGALSISQIWAGGFNVLTWDPRGFGKSGGAAQVDSASFEGKDVSEIINWVAQQKGVETDRPGDPRMGMVGESYGGGIQFVTAAHDCRVDAIAPTIAWHSLTTSLYKSQTPKTGWGNILSEVASSATLNPLITAADKQENASGTITPAEASFFAARGPAQILSGVKVPTLILQGTVDNLFTLDEGIANFETLKAQGTTVSMAWFCGGHGVCLTNPGTAIDVGQLSLAWMQHYVAKDTSVKVLDGVAFVDQNGTSYTSPTWPLTKGTPVTGSGSGTLALKAGGGSGPPTVAPNAQAANAVDAVALAVTPAPATNALTVPITFSASAVVAGAPSLTLNYSGTVPAGVRPERVFAQLVDPTTGIVVGNQVTPIPVILDGATHSLRIPLEAVAFTGAAGATLQLQLVATTVAYVQPRLGGTVTFSHVGISLPTATGLTVLQKG